MEINSRLRRAILFPVREFDVPDKERGTGGNQCFPEQRPEHWRHIRNYHRDQALPGRPGTVWSCTGDIGCAGNAASVDSQIIATAPAGSAGTVDVTVTTPLAHLRNHRPTSSS